MSLFDSASLVVTPNGTKASKLYSIIPTDGSGDLTVTRATTATRVNSSGLIESVANNVPRLDYLNSSCPTILVEPQRTNLATYSEETNNIVWSALLCTVTANNLISPNGTQNADTVTTTANNSFLGRAIVIPIDGATYTQSIFAKWVSGYELFKFRTALTGGSSVAKESVFNLRTGAVISSDTTYKVENYGNGWFRFSHQITNNSTNVSFNYQIFPTNDSTQTQSASFWGMQAEAGSYATSYIPTTTAAVTRNADVIFKTSATSLIGQTEGTIFAEIKVSKLLGTASRYIFHISDGTTNNRIYMAFSGSSSNVLRARIFNGGTLQCSIDTSAITTTGTFRLAMAYKSNDIVFYVNGTQIGTDISATIPTCSRVDLGHNYAGASQLNDGITNANIWKTRLTNAELASLTSL